MAKEKIAEDRKTITMEEVINVKVVGRHICHTLRYIHTSRQSMTLKQLEVEKGGVDLKKISELQLIQ